MCILPNFNPQDSAEAIQKCKKESKVQVRTVEAVEVISVNPQVLKC